MTTICAFSIVTPFLAAGLGVMLSGCEAMEAPIADQSEYLFGLGEDEILAVQAVSERELAPEAWLEMNRAPFSCANYGDLCDLTGREAAYRLIEDGYLMALSGHQASEIADSQWQAFKAAEAQWAALGHASKNTTTQIYTNGSNDKRLKVIAKAIELWPSLDLKAQGECKTQKKVLGVWGTMNSDSISGSMTAVYTPNTITRIRNGSVTNDNSLVLGPVTETADHVDVTVSCTAINGGWSASGPASAYK